MIFEPTALQGVYLVTPELLEDERGFFARTYCGEEFRAHGLRDTIAQCNRSYNQHKGTIRGLHYQREPHAEAKLVTCIAGEVYDVVVDCRSGSPTFRRWIAVNLSARNRTAVYIPEGCAHGFQTLSIGAELFYQMSAPYRRESAAGVRWDDTSLAIAWPALDPIVSPRDRSLPSLDEAMAAGAL